MVGGFRGRLMASRCPDHRQHGFPKADRKKVVDALLEVKRSNRIPAETTEAIQPWEHEKRQPALKRYMNE